MLSTPASNFPRRHGLALQNDHGSSLGAHPDGPQSKKRRTDRACDACRRKKTRCDGPWKSTNVCTSCAQSRKPCTYLEASKPRGPPKAYVVGLEDRIEELEALLAQIRPGTDFTDELGPPIIRDSWKDSEEDPHPSAINYGPTSTLYSSRSASTLPRSSGSASPVSTSLPPLMIPFNPTDKPGTSSLPVRTTHLLFKSRHNLKKQRSSATSDMAMSSPSGSSSAAAPSGPETRSPSYGSSAESDCASSDGSSESDSEDLIETSLAGRNRITLRMDETPEDANKITFHGRSSTAGLVETTRRFKFLHLQESMKMNVVKQDESGNKDSTASVAPSDGSSLISEPKGTLAEPDNSRVAMARRPRFWQTPHWELRTNAPESPNTISAGIVGRFPPPDLCQTLIDLYFTHYNRYFPLLHRPTFQKQWDGKLQDKNFWFASKCLMLFAVASRWCMDERVIGTPPPRDDTDHSPPLRSGHVGGCDIGRDGGSFEKPTQDPQDSHEKRWWYAGLPFFSAATGLIRANANMVHSATLFEVQTLALMGTFLRATTAFPTAWVIVSIGLRKALDAGAHRKRIYRGTPNAEDELWKRAFWHLVVFDRLGGVILGRSVGIGEEDFDTELPLEVDDPYWGDVHGWKQPEDVPCQVAAFNHFVKLTQIVAFTSRTIYALNKPKVFSGMIKGDWRNEVITQLNTSLEEWVESTPAHLKWSEDTSDPILYSLSAALITTYYLTRLLIYRPFIPPPPLLPQSLREAARHMPSSTPLPFPALAICLSSARACTRVLEHQLRRRDWETVNIPNFVNAAYICGGSLLLAFWDLKGQQKAIVKLHSAGVVSSSNSSSGEPDKDSQEFDGNGTLAMDPLSEELDTDQVLQSLKVKMEELLVDIRVLIEALEWVQPRWQFAAPMVAQLKSSMPDQEDLEPKHPPTVPREPVLPRRISFQDIRRQRQQERLRKDSHSEDGIPYRGLRHRASHPGFVNHNRFNDPSSGLFRRSPGNGVPGPAIFVHENHPHLHTMRDEDFDDVESRNQLHRDEYGFSPTDHRNGSRSFFPDQPRHHAYPTPPTSSSVSHTPPNVESMHPHTHDPGRRPSHHHDERLSHSSAGSYARDAFMHPGHAPIPYISGSVRRPPISNTRTTSEDHRESQMLHQETNRVLDSYRPEATIPPRLRPSLPTSSRSSISLDRNGVADEDIKPPLNLDSPGVGTRRHGAEGFSLHIPEDRRYHERHSDVRTDVPSQCTPSVQPELQLRYPWGPRAEGSNTTPNDHNLSSSSYSSSGQWKSHMDYHAGGPGQPSYQLPSGSFVQFQQQPSPLTSSPRGISISRSQERLHALPQGGHSMYHSADDPSGYAVRSNPNRSMVQQESNSTHYGS